MPKPVYLLTVQEAHKEYNSLTNQIWAKYEQLDSGEYGAVGTPAFNAEACEYVNRVWRMQLCSHRYLRITGLLSVPLVLITRDWLSILPAITLVV